MIRLIKRLALAGVSLLALMVAPANAEPVSLAIASAMFAGPLSGVFSFSALFQATQIGIAALSIAAQYLFQPKQALAPTEAKGTFESAEMSEINAIGRVKLGGLRSFGNSTGFNVDRVIWHCRGELIAIEDYEIGGFSVVVEEDGAVSSPPWTRGSGNSWLYIQSKPGTADDLAFTDLVASYPTLLDSNFRSRGIFNSWVRYKSPGINETRWATMYQGGYPDLRVLARIGRVYDPRVPGIDIDDEATWPGSLNGILCAAHIMLRSPDVTIQDFDWALMAGEADKADVLVPTLTGTEPRSQCSGVWFSESGRLEIMEKVLESIGAEQMTEDDGRIWFRLIDDNPDPDVEYDVLDIDRVTFRAGKEAVERPNICRVKYFSPERDYEVAEVPLHKFDTATKKLVGPAWARIASEIERYGEKPYDLELPFCPSASQAQRIARRKFLMEISEQGTAVTNMAGLAQWGLYTAAIPLPDIDETIFVRTDPQKVDDDNGTVEIPFRRIHDTLRTPYDATVDEAPAPEPKPLIQFDSELAKPNTPHAVAIVQYADTTKEIRIAFSPIASGGDIAEASYRISGAYQSMTEYLTGGIWYAYDEIDVTTGDVDARVRFYNNDEEFSPLSDVLHVDGLAIDNTAPPGPSVNGAFSDTDEIQIDVTIRTLALNAVLLVVTGDWPVTQNIRPGEIVSLTIPPLFDPMTINVVVKTSNGTSSPVITRAFKKTFVPGGG